MEDYQSSFNAMNHEQRIEFAKKIFPLIGKYCNENRQYYIDIWPIAEDSGFNVVASDYYSPIPFKKDLDTAVPGEYVVDPGLLDFDIEEQKEYFSKLTIYQRELLDVPFKLEKSAEFFWVNGMFPVSDSYLYYSIIRKERPLRIIEVGSGQSTLIALRALGKNGTGRISCIEPNPDQNFNNHLRKISAANYALIIDELQNVPLSYFQELNENDILFIDSSHVVKSQSDLIYLFFDIIPALKRGVVIHFHDIFLPYDYPTSFFRYYKRFFNEEYFLAAFLINNSMFHTLFSNYYFLWKETEFYLAEMSALLESIEKSAVETGEKFSARALSSSEEMPLCSYVMGGSYWMKSQLVPAS